MACFACSFKKVQLAGYRYYRQICYSLPKYQIANSLVRKDGFCNYSRGTSSHLTRHSPCVKVYHSRRYYSCLNVVQNGTKLYFAGKRGPFVRPRYGTQVLCDQYYTSAIVVGMQDALLNIQSFTGLSWWATIMSTTIFLRLLITLPLARQQCITVARFELIQPMISEIVEALKHNISIKGKRAGKPLEEVNREFQMAAKLHVKGIYKREKCNPLRLYALPWAQLPLWIIISLALRNITGFFPKGDDFDGTDFCNPDLLTGGLGWITDLSVSDPYYVLPAIIGITNYINIELNSLRKKEPSRWQIGLTRLFRTLTVAMVFVAAQVPSAMSLYWATSSSYGLVQNLILMQPSVRRMIQIPKSPSESNTPMKDKLEIIKHKMEVFMKIQRK